MNVYYQPVPPKVPLHRHRRKLQPRQEPMIPWHSVRPMSLDSSCYQVQNLKEIKRRRLPNIELFQNDRIRSLPNIPAVSSDNNAEKFNIPCGCSFDYITQKEETTQYHGYDSDGSEAETTIHVSIDKQNSVENGKSDKCDFGDELGIPENRNRRPSIASIMASNDRKRFLSLDLKSSYEPLNLIQSQSLDIPDEEKLKCNTKRNTEHNSTENFCTIQKVSDCNKTDSNKKSNETNNKRRRHSDYLVYHSGSILKTPESRSSPEEIRDLFKKMSLTSNSLFESTKHIEKSNRRQGNVSINEIPSFQEYCSPSSLFPQSSIDLPLLKPLPSIIKKARTRSHSLASTHHLDREISMMANTMFIALSPPNLGSPRRVLTPVASHPPPDGINHDSHTPADSHTPDKTTSDTETQSAQSVAQRICDRVNAEHDKNQSAAAKTQRGKSASRRESKRSNDYGGRENGRGNNQPQPLERRESRRGQFTRSLSNADVPPDDKAGNAHFKKAKIKESYRYTVTYIFLVHKDGSLSDTALGGGGEMEPVSDDVLLKAEPRDYFGPGMGKKSNSTSQLSATGDSYCIPHFHLLSHHPTLLASLSATTKQNRVVSLAQRLAPLEAYNLCLCINKMIDRTKTEVRFR